LHWLHRIGRWAIGFLGDDRTTFHSVAVNYHSTNRQTTICGENDKRFNLLVPPSLS
jgi:hypothetical protein